ncbi:chaperone protein ClpD chloroplastic-like [Trifolium pratense]|uniref:Chaperone protein ClpD chloroplastic-like n=1 Tax=Trifolium pratense TaxID=57577 RepID=A0A2K3NY46_TRIPR|nr:chaperone protein ClpD chloroplastic-like [Trifolium pratense]
MQVSSSSINPWFGTFTSNRFRRNSSEPCSTTTTSAATTYSRSVHNNNSLSFLTSQTNTSYSFTSLSTRKTKTTRTTKVFTHIMLGLIAEADETNRSQNGFLDSPVVTLEKARDAKARDAVRHLNDSTDYVDDDGVYVYEDRPVPFSFGAKRVFEAAAEYSKSLGHNFVDPEHIFVAIIKVDDGSSARILYRLGTNPDQLAAVAYSRIQKELARDGRELGYQSNGMHNKSISKKPDAGSATKTKEKTALSQFCVDLTARASLGLIDPVIGREVEVQRIIQILCRKSKSNPILLGEAGVGKTAIAEGLANRISQADVAPFLLTKRVMSLDVASLMAGAKERGELEDRVTKLIKEIIKSGDVILFIDEVHTLVQSGTTGKGNKGSGFDIANLLKPALGRATYKIKDRYGYQYRYYTTVPILFKCIASTTTDEYRLHFEKDKALARRFQPVWIDEPSEDDAIEILMGIREKYEAHHKCRYTEDAIKAAVHLSARYIVDRYLPDKAIDLIDEAGSKASIEAFKMKKEQNNYILSKNPEDYWGEIRTVQSTLNMVQESKLKYYGASGIEDTGELILDSYLTSAAFDNERIEVRPDHIAEVASLWSGIPVKQLTADERSLLLDLDNKLRERVIGQEEAVSAISRSVKRSRVGLKDPSRPIATLLFCGPTGVGKTELAKSLAACYFGSETDMIRLDMSEYMERHSVSKLIGSPPGYVGYGEGGILTEAIRRKPFTVLLLDEIEKAHPDVFNILLQLLEDGHLTDSQGRRVSFKNALVVMTSNVGSSAIAKGRHNSIGFFFSDDKPTSYNGLKSMVIEELRTYFRPELLNRIDEVVVFHPLEKPQLLQILELLLQDLKKRALPQGIDLEVSESVKDLVCTEGYDTAYGARPLRRAIVNIIENPLTEALLAEKFKKGDTAFIDLDANGNTLVINQLDQKVNLSDISHL